MFQPRSQFLTGFPVFLLLFGPVLRQELIATTPPVLLPTLLQGQTAEPASLTIQLQVNGTELRKMTTGKKIAKALIGEDGHIRVVQPRPEEIVIAGLSAGRSHLTLTDEDGKVESFTVLVFDFDFRRLETALRRAVPSANISLLPPGKNIVILRGTVDRVEDLRLACDVAESTAAGVRLINGLRVAAPQQVRLEIVAAVVRGGLARNFTLRLLKDCKPASTDGASQPQSFAGILDCPRDTEVVKAFLTALREEGLVEGMPEPCLLTVSGKKASFLVERNYVPPPDPTFSGSVGVQFEEFGTRLQCLPTILDNGNIHLDVEAEACTPNGKEKTPRMHPTADLKAGQTLVFGGLLHQPQATKTKRHYTPAVSPGPAHAKKPTKEEERFEKFLEEILAGVDRSQTPPKQWELDVLILVTPKLEPGPHGF